MRYRERYVICPPMISCEVFQFRSNYRLNSTIYPATPLSIALLLRIWKFSCHVDSFGGDEGRQSLQKYIDFCHAGEFVIK